MPLRDAYTADELAERCARAEIEIERLRAALREIIGLAVNPELGGGLINARRIAREALKIAG